MVSFASPSPEQLAQKEREYKKRKSKITRLRKDDSYRKAERYLIRTGVVKFQGDMKWNGGVDYESSFMYLDGMEGYGDWTDSAIKLIKKISETYKHG